MASNPMMKDGTGRGGEKKGGNDFVKLFPLGNQGSVKLLKIQSGKQMRLCIS